MGGARACAPCLLLQLLRNRTADLPSLPSFRLTLGRIVPFLARMSNRLTRGSSLRLERLHCVLAIERSAL